MGTVRLAPGLGPRLCWRRAQTAGEKPPRGPCSPQARQSVRTALVFQVFFFFFPLLFSPFYSINETRKKRAGIMEGESPKPSAGQWHFFLLPVPPVARRCVVIPRAQTCTRARTPNTEEPAGLTDPPFSLFGIFKEDRTIHPPPHPLGATRIHVEM